MNDELKKMTSNVNILPLGIKSNVIKENSETTAGLTEHLRVDMNLANRFNKEVN
jgi:hypothetical protein